MDEAADLVREFLVESHEGLDQVDRELVALEREPGDAERLASVFRTFHTIKGTCGFLGFSKLEAVTHAGEHLLSRLRDGAIDLTPDVATALLALVDAVREILTTIEATGQEGEADYTYLVDILARLAQGTGAGTAPTPPAGALQCPPTPARPPAAEPEPPDLAAPIGNPGAEAQADGSESPRSGEGRPGVERLQGVAESCLRVDVGLLDKLMNLVGELVLARNQILQFTATQSDVAFLGATQRLNLVTSELQEGVMKTRMQPIRTIWGKFPRVVRDLAAACGKQVRLEQEGEDTELDKAIIEAIKDPLTHIIRNAVDHGIEPPEVRVARGKPPAGTLRLRAYHEGGQINIEISDDGAGIDPDRIRRKAIERGLVTPDQAGRMSEHDLLRLIFQPGFSTADRVTNVSGRGVGMDVVKTNIERIGGAVDLHSSIGEGTVLRIKIPLTLAIIPALMVSSGGQSFAIPQVNLTELVRLEGEHARRGVEQIQGARFYRLRGQLLPLVVLHEQLGLAPATDVPDPVNIVVLKVDARQFGVVVEAIDDTEEIVVKPLDPELKELSIFAGATIRGDGRVVLILDAIGLAQRASAISELAADHGSLVETGVARSAAKQAFLVFSVGGGAPMALPLEQVARLEEFPAANIERAGHHDVVQYRGGIMPLVDLPRLLSGRDAAHDPRQVVVIANQGARVGLVVEHVMDIAHEAIAPMARLVRDGVSGSATVLGRVTELLDVEGVLRLAGLARPRAERAA